MTSLHDAILQAHDQRDQRALVDLYHQAAQTAASVDEACFFATHAYIFALEIAHSKTAELHRFLCKHKREE